MSRRVAFCISWVGIVFVVAFGCTESHTIECANGLVCPSGYVCDDDHARCALPEQRTACEAKADLDPCSTAAITDGVCSPGTCLAAWCGSVYFIVGVAAEGDDAARRRHVYFFTPTQ